MDTTRSGCYVDKLMLVCQCHIATALEGLDRHDHGIVSHLGRETGSGIELRSLDAADRSCSARRRQSAADPIATAILADLAPASTGNLDPPLRA